MFSPVPYLLFLLLNTICSFTSSKPDAPPVDIIASPDFEINSIGLPSNSQDGGNKLDIDAGEPSEAAPLIIQGNKNQCAYNSNQNSWRKERSKRADFCLPLTDNGQPAIQDSTTGKKRRPGFEWQIVPQKTQNGPTKAPFPDESRCPRTAPFPVCAFSTVATVHPDLSYPNAGSTAGRWILDYCRCKRFPLAAPPSNQSFDPCDLFPPTRNGGEFGEFPQLINAPWIISVSKPEIGCDRTAGEGFWCCQFASAVKFIPHKQQKILSHEKYSLFFIFCANLFLFSKAGRFDSWILSSCM